MEFVDIAGLVAGASKGEGLGNQFLAHIRETQAIAHVVRCFDNSDVIHVTGRVDPLADIEVIHTELALADLETVDRAVQRVAKQTKSGDKEALAKKNLFEHVLAQLDNGNPVRALPLSDEDRAFLQELHLLTIKPTLYIANVSEDGFHDNPYLEQLIDFAQKEGAECVPVCAATEAELISLDEADRIEFLKDMGLSEAGLNRVIRAGYHLLNLHTFFTAGPKEVRAWTIEQGATAPQAAGTIHTDFEKGFIRAEVVSYADFIAHQGEHGAKETGKWRLEGKDYIVKDGDVMHFRFNV